MKLLFFFKKIFIVTFIFIFAFELFSLIGSKLNLLVFNSDPVYFGKTFAGNDSKYTDPLIGPWHKINTTSRHKSNCFDVNYQFNNIGARDDKDYKESTFDNSIIVLGDSFPFGHGLNIENTFSKIIENELDNKVINLSVSGTSPIDYSKRFKYFSKQKNYSEIVYFFLPQNDFVFEDTTKNVNKDNKNYNYYQSLKNILSKFTYSFNTLATIKFIYFNKDKTYDNFSYNINERELIDKTNIFIEEVMKVQNKKKTLVLIPTRKDFQNIDKNKKYKELYWYMEIKKMSDKYNFKIIDLYDVFKVEEQFRYYHKCDGHWNAYGAKITAQYFLDNR